MIYTTVLQTICFPYRDDEILLGMKKRGWGANRWNGFGGKVENETLEVNVVRETKEEAGITVSDIEQIGILHFYFVGDAIVREVHVSRTNKWTGEPAETEEMIPRWFKKTIVPTLYDEMWPVDRYWMPFVLTDKKFKGEVHYKDKNTILRYDIKEVEGF